MKMTSILAYLVLTAAIGAYAADERGPQVVVTCVNTSHVYRVGERALFEVTSPGTNVQVQVSFSRAYLPPLETFVTSTPARVSFALGEPGFVVCNVRPYLRPGVLGRDILRAGAGFDPLAIRTALPPPADYDEFWKGAFAEQEAIKPDWTVKSLGNGVELISCRTVWGTRMYGFLFVPKGEGPFPLQVSVGGGSSIYWSGFAVSSALQKPFLNQRGFLFIHLPGWEPDCATRDEAIKLHYKWLESEPSLRQKRNIIYWNCTKGPRERWYYRCVLGSCRLVEYAVAQPRVDRKRVYYRGASTGGGYGVFLAAFSPHIRAAVCEFPNYGNAGGPSAGRPSGEDDRGAYWKTSLYYDGAYCASRIRCPVFLSCGYTDNSCCPETVYCIFNALTCPKTMFNGVDFGHGTNDRAYRGCVESWLDAKLRDLVQF